MGCSDLMANNGKCEDIEIWRDYEIEIHQSEEYKRYLEYQNKIDDLNSVKSFVIWKWFGGEF